MSIWPVVTAVAVPYVWVLRVGDQVAGDAIASGMVVGFLLAATFCAFGLLMSTFAASNRTSLAVTFFIFFALAIPTQLPCAATAGWLGELIMRVNPMTAGSHFIKQVTVADHAWGQEADWLIAPLVGAVVLPLAVLLLAGRLRLQGGFAK